MPLVSELVAKLEADTKHFNKNINNSEKRLTKFAKTAAKVGAGIALAIGTVAVAGFIKLLSIINETAKDIDKLAKTSRKLGIAVNELQFIQFQANLAGVSTEKLNMGLQRMTRRVSEAAQGTGEAQNALKELNLDAKELASLSPDRQFAKIGEALKGVSNQADRVRLGFKLFDSEGVDIINAFTGDVQSLRKEFEDLGISLTGPQTKAVEAYNDSVTKLSLIWESFKQQLTVQVAPALEMIVNWIKDTIIQMGGLGPLANKVAQMFVSGLQLIVAGAQKVINVINGIRLAFKNTQLALLEFMQTFSEFNFEVLGGDFNFKRLDTITKLQKDIKELQKSGGETLGLQRGLTNVQSTLQQQSKQQIEVKISTEKGFKAEVAESPEVTRAVNKLIGINAERAE